MTKEELLKRKSDLNFELKEIKIQLDAIKKQEEKIDDIKLNKIYKSSELIYAINERYKNVGMVVSILRKNNDGKTFKMELGKWDWKGAKEFIGKNYFKTKKFTNGDCDGYDDPKKFMSEILGIKNFGSGGIASNWYRGQIEIPEGFDFDVEK